MSTDKVLPVSPAVPANAAAAFNTSSSLHAQPSSSVWDRISTWASENKAIVYTIAGVAVVVTSAGVVYYLTDSGRSTDSTQPAEKKKSKKERRREKKKAEEEKKAEVVNAASGTATILSQKHNTYLGIDARHRC